MVIRFFFVLVALASFTYIVSAQEDNGLPNNGLKHRDGRSDPMAGFDNRSVMVITNPPAGPVRNIAEWEPSEAVIIAYLSGFGLPVSLIKDLSNTGKVIIDCKSSSQTTAMTTLTNGGVNTANCQFITTTVDSWWTRDYTGWFIADSSNRVAIVDFPYNRPSRVNDDAIPSKQATLLNITLYGMDVEHTGGNYMCDGYGRAVSTDLVLDENSLTTTQINQRMLSYLGIENYMIRPDAQGDYIKHIDCWAKLLAPDKILVDSVPPSDSRYTHYQAAAAFFASTNSPYGYPYKVYRPLIVSSTGNDAYSNSFIFKNRVFVPLGGNATRDSAAIQCYRTAMPGYIVKGYNSSGSAAWYGTDALHCRTHEIADRNMLYIQHFPLWGVINSPTGYAVNAKVVSYAGNNIAAGYPRVVYKVGRLGQWDSTLVMAAQGSLQYSATIPVQNDGDTVYYYIKAKDVTGIQAMHAVMGPADPYFFIVDNPVNIPVMPSNPAISFFTYPNPSKGSFILFTQSNYPDQATVNIYSLSGRLVYTQATELMKGTSKARISTEGLDRGIYIIEVITRQNISTGKLVIE
jgi:agmatine/peptidylarginine deiminase